MSTTEPIRNTIELSRFMDYYKTECANHRNYAMIMLGLYSALRISDILNLKWSDIYDFKGGKIKSAVTVKEQKTGKINNFALNNHIQQALSLYLRKKSISADEYVFCQRLHPNKPICRSQAYRIVRKAANATVFNESHISCHSLRKTFGYHAWKQGIPPALLMDIYNHSSYKVTKKYLGISQDERNSVYLKLDYSNEGFTNSWFFIFLKKI